MRLQNLARFPEIGSNSLLVEMGKTRIALDAGTHPKHTGRETLPRYDLLEPGTLDGIVVSHPHLDHIGALPVLMRQHPDAAVVLTDETRESGSALLHNSVNVMKSQRDELDEPSYPLYSHEQVDELMRYCYSRRVAERFSLGKEDRVECEFYHAGHVLGAIGVRLEAANRRLFYTGDVHFEDQTMVKAAAFPDEPVDTLVIETTRGGHPRREDYTRADEKRRLGETIARTLAGGGSVLIPVFAFGKTQETLLMLEELREEGLIPVVPIHIGGLSTRMSQIADKFRDSPWRFHRGRRLLESIEDLRILPRGHREPEFDRGRIYALSSGMMSQHTVSNRFSRHILGKEENALVFVGYADPETPAGKILEVGQGGRVRLDSQRDHETLIRCSVERFDFSGHAPRDQIVDYAVSLRPRNVILVHGDPVAKTWFQETLSKKLPGSRVLAPAPGEWVEL